MSGEGDERRAAAVRRPEVVSVAEAEVADDESCRVQAGGDERLATGIIRGDGGAADERLQEVEGGVHGDSFRDG